MQSFTVLCEKLLLSIVVLKIIFIKYFPQNDMLTKCLGRENLELFCRVRVTPKSSCGPLGYDGIHGAKTCER